MKKWWVTMLMMCLDHLGVALVVDVVAVAALKVVAAVLAEIALIMVVRAVCTVYDEVSLSPIWMVGDKLPIGGSGVYEAYASGRARCAFHGSRHRQQS